MYARLYHSTHLVPVTQSAMTVTTVNIAQFKHLAVEFGLTLIFEAFFYGAFLASAYTMQNAVANFSRLANAVMSSIYCHIDHVWKQREATHALGLRCAHYES